MPATSARLVWALATALLCLGNSAVLALVCWPTRGTTFGMCNKRIASCSAEGVRLKWTGTGCKNPLTGKALKDGGCQCDQYCGYKCSTACNLDRQCHWKEGKGCINLRTGLVGTAMPRCFDVTARPSTSPTTSQPTTSPTTSRPSISPSGAPSGSPTTPQPSTSPTTSRPSTTPSTSPSLSPTPPTFAPTPQPTSDAPSKAPTTSRPSAAPTTSRPSASPTTSRPSANPTTSAPSRTPTTSRPSRTPTTSRPSRTPTTKRPTLPTRSPTKMPTTRSPTTRPSRSPTSACGSCSAQQTCVKNVCIGLGNLQITINWSRLGQMNLWIYPPVAGTYIGDANQNMPNALSAGGQLDQNNVYGTGPGNAFWDATRTPPPGVYKVCAETWFFDPPVETAVPSSAVSVVVDITKKSGVKEQLTATITEDSYWTASPECKPLGTTDGLNSWGYLVGTFTI